MKLLDYFMGALDREIEAAPHVEEQSRETVTDFVSRPGYGKLKEWLAVTIEAHKPQPGTERDMLYQMGVRDGLELVQKKFRLLEEFARRVEDA